MTFAESLESLHADEAVRRREFPVVAEKTYLAHAAVCPLPACVSGAIAGYLDKISRGGQFEYLHAAAETGARQLAAAMLGATPEEIAFVPSTSAGLGLIAAGLPWKPGDSVVYPEGDFPSNVYPWQALAKRGVQLRPLPPRAYGEVTLQSILDHVDDRTRLVALSSVHYATGACADLDTIGRELALRGIRLCVDAIQSLGALPTSAKHVDFLVADAHKWLLGAQGMGILFVRRSRFDLLKPPLLGWKSVRDQKDFVRRDLMLADTARRYEPGSLNALGLVGLHAALQMLQHIGVPKIADYLARLRTHLVPPLAAKGYEILGPGSGDTISRTITSFRRDATDMAELHRKLDQNGIVTSLRKDPLGRDCIRIAPHFYNTIDELDRLLAFV